jgi:hypothetical protein
VHELLDSSSVRFHGHALGTFDVHQVKSLFAMFNIETDCIHHTTRASHRIGHRSSVANIGPNYLESGIIGTEQRPATIRVPRRDPHDASLLMQTANDAPAEETGCAENGDNA